jgi:hypothetical protein
MITGRLDRLHLGDLMQWLTMGALSGRLALRDRVHERRIDFLDGRVVYASSTAPSERLATWLTGSGLLAPDLARRLLARSLLDRRLFTDVLVEEGIPAEAIHRLLSQLAAAVVSRSLNHEELEFRFDEAYPVRDLMGVSLNVEPNSLLMEAARRLDEHDESSEESAAAVLPFEGRAFETLFWELVAEGVPESEPMAGSELARVAETIRLVVRTLAQWLDSSPGLVPLPESQADAIAAAADAGEPVSLTGRPQSVWNQAVFATSVHGADIVVPETLAALEEAAANLNLWNAMAFGDTWRRPAVPRLDALSSSTAETWSHAAAAAAKVIGCDPGTARLAAHLVVVPTDLVLWALSSLQVSHHGLRAALLDQLPRRLGTGLARRAVFPDSMTSLFTGREPTPLAVALDLARETLPGASVWLATGPEDPADLVERFEASRLTAASEAARSAAAPHN